MKTGLTVGQPCNRVILCKDYDFLGQDYYCDHSFPFYNLNIDGKLTATDSAGMVCYSV